MKRHPAKRYPKHVRRAVARLLDAGAGDVRLEIGRIYLLSWTYEGRRMRVPAVLSATARNAFEGLWNNIRALFRTRGLPVPA